MNQINNQLRSELRKRMRMSNFGVKYLCEQECKRSSVQSIVNTKAKATNYLGGIGLTLSCVATVV